jgi:glycosyltransferase involved in cell wall biosynthesis
MSNRKLRVLAHTEASYLSTGFATYGRHLLMELHKTGKYEIAELANYGSSRDPRRFTFPWKYYAVKPNHDEQQLLEVHDSDPGKQFGGWRFEDTCLDFKPDVVISWLDPWMFKAAINSPFRPFYKLALMPTVDSAPQREEWIDDFIGADAVLTYQDWSKSVLEKQGGGLINLIGSAPPGANTKAFKPVADKRALKSAAGLNPDWFIVGSVMRNQRRKLYPDLFEAFRMFLDKHKGTELASRSYLYIHSSYPDLGWDIPFLIKRYGLGRHALFTYVCENQECRAVFPSFFQDARTICVKCKKPSARLPNVNLGATEEALGEIMNLFDVYVQWATREGMGMPAVEAAACALPVVEVDYSAMEDVVRKVQGYPIKPLKLSLECEVQADGAIPDNAALVEVLTELANMTPAERKKKGFDARIGVLRNYTYAKAAQVWMSYLDTVTPRDWSETWNSPPRLHTPAQQIPENLPPTQFIEWAMTYVLGKPEELNSHLALQLIKYLNWGMIPVNQGQDIINESSMFGNRPVYQGCDFKTVINILSNHRNAINHWEQRRVGMIQVPTPEFIIQANQDMQQK